MLLTIVTISYNDLPGLKLSIQSLSKFINEFEEIEHVIIDGNSRDGTKDFLENKFCSGFWISEPDNGPCDALNKGITNSKGKYILFLNAGDLIAKELTLEQFRHILNILSSQTFDLVSLKVKNTDINKFIFPPNYSNNIRNKAMSLHHQGTFYFRKIFQEIGGYDEEYGMRGDLEMNLRILTRTNPQIKSIRDIVITEFRGGGMTSSFRGSFIFHKLGFKAYKLYGLHTLKDRGWWLLGCMKIIKRAARLIIKHVS